VDDREDLYDRDAIEHLLVSAPAFAATADDATEAWVQRFRRERQASWSSPAW